VTAVTGTGVVKPLVRAMREPVTTISSFCGFGALGCSCPCDAPLSASATLAETVEMVSRRV
jgi:hypothetical protein